jgi:hypothetical protein
MHRRFIALALSGLMSSALLVGCAEKKTCYFQCFEPAIKGYTKDCGMVERVSAQECRQMKCDEGRDVRTSWGEVPDWCTNLGGGPVKTQQ